MKKVFIDCRMLHSGGIGTYLESLLPYFIKNYECILLGSKEKLQKYSELNAQIIPCDIPCFSVKELFSFPKEILKKINSCDIYYSPYCNVPSKIKIPVFTTIHDVVFLDVKELAGFAGRLARKYFYKRAIKKSKAIFTVSQFSKERILHHLHTGKKPVIVTYNSVPEWFLDDYENLPKTDIILFVGNIKKHKGLETLLKAFSIVLSKKIKLKLVLVGNKDNFRSKDNHIWQLISQMPENTVNFTGRITDSQLKNYYQEAKLLVQPSFYEGFGMPPLEALSSRTNVVLSDIPVFKEIYKDFPVTFFECGNENDLAQKIIENYAKEPPKNIPQIYSFSKTFDIINGELEKSFRQAQ